MALSIITAFSVEQAGDSSTLIFTVKGKPKVPENVETEAAGRGVLKVKVPQEDQDALYAVGAALAIDSDTAPEVDKEDQDIWDWVNGYFIPTKNGGGYEAEGSDGGEPAEEPEAEFVPDENTDETPTPEPEEKPVKTKPAATKKAPPAAKAAPAKAAPKAAAPSKQKAAETKAAAKGKATAKAAPAKAPKAPKPPKEPKAPKEAKPARADYDTSDIDAALIAFAKEHGIRVTHVITKRSLQCLQDTDKGIKMGTAPADITTIGVIPGKTYEVTKNHKEWGECSYKVQVLKDGIKLTGFKGNDAKRGLKVGTTYPHAKAMLKDILQLPDPHVSFYKFFNL